MDDFWVFGYGSLMWNPGFTYKERMQARLHGYRRTLCIKSNVYRGTVENPGLVLGLDRGGSCHGVAFRVCGSTHDEVMGYLRARELVTNVYLERIVNLTSIGGQKINAITYVADPRHPQYVSGLDTYNAAKIVYGASGSSGPNQDYVVNTITQLNIMGIRDTLLEEVADHIRQLQAY